MDQPTRLGRYRLYKKLAASAVHETYIARPADADTTGNELIVRKLTQRLRQSGEVVDLLRREVEIASSLVHPNIARTFEFGQADGRDAYIVAEYVWGEDLRRIAERGMTVGRFLPIEHAVRVVADVAEALAYLHDKRDDSGNPLRLVHGDVSPSNILVSFSGRVKLVEVGLAPAEQKAAEAVQPGRLQAKYAYMSPEQVQGLDVDARSDLFSLGTVLYELTTRKRLFKGSDEVSTMRLVSEAAVKAPSESLPSYPPALERIVLKALSRDPAQRYARAVELRADLLAFLEQSGAAPRAEDLADYMRGVFPDRLKELEALLGEGYAGPTGDLAALLAPPPSDPPAAPRPPVPAPASAAAPPKPKPASKAAAGDRPTLPKFNAPSSPAVPVVSRPPAPPQPPPPPTPPPPPRAAGPVATPPPEPRLPTPEPLPRAEDARPTSPEHRPVPAEAHPSGMPDRPDFDASPSPHAFAMNDDDFRPPTPPPQVDSIEESLPPPLGFPADAEGSGPRPLDEPGAPRAHRGASPRPPRRESRVTTAEHTLRKDKPDVHEQTIETSGKVMRLVALVLLAAVGVAVWYGTTYGWPWDEARLGGGVERRRVEQPPPPDLPATIPVQVRSEPAGAAVAVNGVISEQRTPATVQAVPDQPNTFVFYMDGYATQVVDVPIGPLPPSAGVSATLEAIVMPEGWTPPPPDPTSDAPPITEWTQPTGHLTVTTEPVGATILVNGRDVCRSPCEELVVFADQEMHVAARLDGYLDVVAFPVAPPWDYHNDTKYVHFVLREPPESGQIYTYFEIFSTPSDANVVINGQQAGQTEMNVPRRIDALQRIELQLPEHEPWARSFYPSVGRFELSPILQRIRREPSQLTLLIDTPGFEQTKIYLRSSTAESANEIGTGSVQAFLTESGSYELTLSNTPPPETGLPRQRSRVTVELPPNVHITERYAWDGVQFALVERTEGPFVDPPEQPRP